MRIRKPGRVVDQLWFLGREESGIYLLQGREATMLISGGMSYLVPEILKQLDGLGIEEEEISKLLILHSHFDHVGVIPFFKRRLPHLEVLGSARAWEILRMEKAIVTINQFSRKVAERVNAEEAYLLYDLEWRDDVRGETVRGGDQIDLGGLSVSILEIPGHSSCCLAAYVPELKALFPTDGGGIPFGETIITSGNSNYTQYQESLEKLRALEVEVYCADHYGYLTGEEAKTFLTKTIDAAKRNRALMEEVYRETQDIDLTARRLIRRFYDEHPSYFLSPEIFLDVYRQMIRHIANALNGKA